VRVNWTAVVLVFLVMGGCASVVRNPVPEADYLDVTVLGDEDVRQWGDGKRVRVVRPLSSDTAELERDYGGIMHREHNYLVISGGGPRGAYGAGILTAGGLEPDADGCQRPS